MKIKGKIVTGILAGTLGLAGTQADERRFTYSYEPETMLQGAIEFEQWVTWRTLRTDAIGQRDYNLWEIRSAVEYGVTDNYVVELYVNTQNESFRNPAIRSGFSRFSFEGVSIENRYMVLNPATHAVGLTLYLEPRFSGPEAEIEQKIILGQRHGAWKWALNLTHSIHWEDNLHTTSGEIEGSFGVARNLDQRWSLGLELRDHNEIPAYKQWANTAVFLGPVLSYRREKWWAALTVAPQIFGRNFLGNPAGDPNLELATHESLNIRLIFGIDF